MAVKSTSGMCASPTQTMRTSDTIEVRVVLTSLKRDDLNCNALHRHTAPIWD